MKLSKAMLILLMLGSFSILAASCGARQDTAAAAQEQEVTVGRGDISVDITAAGNLALSVKEDLAFDIPGTVEEVLVDEGDSVKKDQVLARLDTSEWDKQLTTLERAVTTAQRQVTATQKTLRDKQNAITTAHNQLTSKQYTLTSAQYDLQAAQDAVAQIADVKALQDQIDTAQDALNLANRMLAAGGDLLYWSTLQKNARDTITQANKDMKVLLAGTSTTVSSNVALDVAKKELAVDQKQLGITQAQFDLENTKLALEDAQNAIVPAQEDVKNAQDDLVTAQKNLADAKTYGPEVKAPFEGFITKVSVKGGDTVKKGTIAVTVADPTKFEADVLVNETDIANVKVGSLTSVTLQASPSTVLSANVTHIAPTATIQQGVVNYKVTVEIQNSRLAASASSAQGQARLGANFGSGNLSPGSAAGLRQAFASGNLTQEQINQLRQQAQQGGGGPFALRGQGANITQQQVNQLAQQRQSASGGLAGQAGGTSQSSATQRSRSQLTGRVAATAGVQLAEGMTVSVALPVESRTNVIVVPNGAITTKGGQASVKVRKADGTTEERLIQTGISDLQNTEVMTGLAEGEKVIITRKTTTSSNTNRQGQGNQIRIPAGGAIFGR